MRGHIITVAFGLAAAAGVADAAMAQECSDRVCTPAHRSKDEAVTDVLSKKENGVVIAGANVIYTENPASCSAVWMTLYRDGKWTGVLVARSPSYVNMKVLKPGEYTVQAVACDQGLVPSGTTYRGPFATFRVGAGELVNAGVLVLRFQSKTKEFLKQTGTLHKAVERSGADADKKIKEGLPGSSAQMIHRPMTSWGLLT